MPRKLSPTKWAMTIAEDFAKYRERGMSNDAAVERLRRDYPNLLKGLTSSTIMREARRAVVAQQARAEEGEPRDLFSAASVPPGLQEELPPELKLEHIPAHVWCDLHAPQHDERLVEAALSKAVQAGIKRLYLPGDAINASFLSGFVDSTKYSPDATEREMRAIEGVFSAIMSVFDEVVLVGGNHDQGRWQKVTEGRIGFERFLRMVIGDRAKELIISDRRYVLVETHLGTWRITHQAGRGRKVPLSSASELANKTAMNVIMGHEHTLGVVKEGSGRYWACSGGFMGDASLMEYKIADTTNTVWAPGFVELGADAFPRLWPAEVVVQAVSVPGLPAQA